MYYYSALFGCTEKSGSIHRAPFVSDLPALPQLARPDRGGTYHITVPQDVVVGSVFGSDIDPNQSGTMVGKHEL